MNKRVDGPDDGAASDSHPDVTSGPDAVPSNIPYERFKAVNAARKRAETELARIQEARAAETAAHRAELEALWPRAAEAEAMQTAFDELLAARMRDVPGHIRDLLVERSPVEALRWLEQHSDKLGVRPAPATDAGQQGDRSSSGGLSDAQRRLVEMAAKAGYAVDAAQVAAQVAAHTRKS